MYGKTGGVIQGFASTFARNKLYELEKKVYEQTGSKEEALKLRPAKGQDSTIALMNLMLSALKDILSHVELEFTTGSDGEITDFTYKYPHSSEAG